MDNKNAIKWLKAISDEQGSSPHKNSRAERERNGCPRCHRENEHNEIIYKGQKYCAVCGQAIDWW